MSRSSSRMAGASM